MGGVGVGGPGQPLLLLLPPAAAVGCAAVVQEPIRHRSGPQVRLNVAGVLVCSTQRACPAADTSRLQSKWHEQLFLHRLLQDLQDSCVDSSVSVCTAGSHRLATAVAIRPGEWGATWLGWAVGVAMFNATLHSTAAVLRYQHACSIPQHSSCSVVLLHSAAGHASHDARQQLHSSITTTTPDQQTRSA